MRKVLFILSVLGVITACSGSQKDKPASDEAIPIENANMVTYKYKVDGLQDTIISDSIWRIIFQVEGIDKLVLSREDSVAIFTVDSSVVSNEMLKKEIVSRGGILVN